METFPYTSRMDGLDGREIGLRDTEPREVLKILANVHRRRVASRGFSHDLKEFSGKVIHHHAAILAIPNLSRERMNLPASKTHPRQSFRFVVRLHLRNELSVAALSLNDGNDARTLPARVPHNQMMGNMAMLQPVAILRLQRQRRNERWWRRPFGKRFHQSLRKSGPAASEPSYHPRVSCTSPRLRVSRYRQSLSSERPNSRGTSDSCA